MNYIEAFMLFNKLSTLEQSIYTGLSKLTTFMVPKGESWHVRMEWHEGGVLVEAQEFYTLKQGLGFYNLGLYNEF